MRNELVKLAILGALAGLGQKALGFVVRHPFMTALGAGGGYLYYKRKLSPEARLRQERQRQIRRLMQEQLEAYRNFMQYYRSIPSLQLYSQMY